MANCAQSPSRNPGSPIQVEHRQSPSRQLLPSGSCNFRDLSRDNSPHTCGCRRFWLNTVSTYPVGSDHRASPRGNDQAWCFCGHHACFHDFKCSSPTSPRGPDNSRHQNHTRRPGSGTGHRILSAVPSFPSHTGLTNTPSFIRHNAINPADLYADPSLQPPEISHGLDNGQPRHNQISVGCMQPPIPTQHVPEQYRPDSPYEDMVAEGLGVYLGANDDLPSTAPAARLARESFGKGRTDRPFSQDSLYRTISSPAPEQGHHAPHNPDRTTGIAPVQLAAEQDVEDAAQSVTEVATPSLMGTPALQGADKAIESLKTGIDEINRKLTSQDPTVCSPFAFDRQGHSVIEQLLRQLTSVKAILLTNPNLATSISNINNRIDALECGSFGHSSVEEVQERLELFEGRLIELEDKIEELERSHALADHGRQNHSFDASMPSEANTSFASGTFNNPTSRQVEVFDRIEHAESRLRSLKGTVPSPHILWTFEVVLLPWGRELKGLWCSPEDSTQPDMKPATQTSEDWRYNGEGKTFERITASDAEGYSIGWANHASPIPSDPANRLMPRACAKDSVVYDRLKSRGFVQQVICRDNNPAAVRSLIQGSFQHLQALFLGPALLPLRKVHKASKLSFLAPLELDHPDLWSIESLDSNVVMKTAGGQRTLFVTNASGYLQRPESIGDTWQKLRELPRFGPSDPETGSHVGEADAAEPCWQWNPRLDPPISVHSSFSSGLKPSANSSFLSHPLSPQPTDRSPSPTSADDRQVSEYGQSAASCASNPSRPAPITPMSEHPMSLPPNRQNQFSQFRRTISLPLASPSQPHNQNFPKRNIASFEHATSSTTAIRRPLASDQKRRRLSRTPEANITAWGLTPRRSREPASPREQEQQEDESGEGRDRAIRNISPVYATPFSNNVTAAEQQQHQQQQPSSSSVSALREHSGLTVEKGSCINSTGMAEEDEAWEGVKDDDNISSHSDGDAQIGFSNDMDLDDGIASNSDIDDDDECENESDGDVDVTTSDEEYAGGAQVEDMDEE